MHIKKEHTALFVPKRINSAKRLAARAVQAHQVALEMNRLSKRGIRFLPKSKLDSKTKEMIEAWIKRLNTSEEVRENLLLSGLDQMEKGISSQKEFLALQASIKESLKLSTSNLPGLYEKSTRFNPQVAGEILKLAFSLNKSWSFAAHLLLLYGLEAMAEELSTTGTQPPIQVESPSKAMAENQKQMNRDAVQAERDKAFQKRNPNFFTGLVMTEDRRKSDEII